MDTVQHHKERNFDQRERSVQVRHGPRHRGRGRHNDREPRNQIQRHFLQLQRRRQEATRRVPRRMRVVLHLPRNRGQVLET